MKGTTMININCKASNPFGSHDEFVQFMVSENEFHIDKAFAALRDGKAYAIHTTFSITCDNGTWSEDIPCRCDVLMGYCEA